MDPAVYWRSALGLFWAFMFVVMLALLVGLSYLSKLTFYPYAIFLSVVLLLFLTAFLLFDKRIKAGFYMCLVLSALFVLNQLVTLYFLFLQPAEVIPVEVLARLAGGETMRFPLIVSALLLLWGIFLFFATLKSKPVFSEEMRKERLAWLVKLREIKQDKIKNAILTAKKARLFPKRPPDETIK
jgi:hypothetical protein